jgi:hypothetical protein
MAKLVTDDGLYSVAWTKGLGNDATDVVHKMPLKSYRNAVGTSMSEVNPQLLKNNGHARAKGVGTGEEPSPEDKSWQIWYRDGLLASEWEMGKAVLMPSVSDDFDFNTVRWAKGNWHDESVLREVTLEEYRDAVRRLTITEEDPNKDTGYESPRRRELFKQAAKDMVKLGKKRIEQKFSNVNNFREVGDVVYVAVQWRQNETAGDTNLVGVISEVFPKHKYYVVTHAGRIRRKVQRNECTLRVTSTAALVGIPDCVYKLPPLTEREALKAINPLVNSGVYGSCLKVKGWGVDECCE